MNKTVFDVILLALVIFLLYKLWNITNSSQLGQQEKSSQKPQPVDIVISDDQFSEFRELYQRLMMSYADGNLEDLREILSDKSYEKFVRAIEARRERNEMAYCDEIKIIHMDLSKSSDSDSEVAIVVKSEQVAYVLNDSGNIINGSKERRYSVDCLKLKKSGSDWIIVSLERK